MIENSYTEAVRVALKADPFLIHAVSYRERSPLHYTSIKFNDNVIACRPEIAKTLLAFNADPNMLDNYNRAPLHYSAVNNCVETAGALRSAGALAYVEDDEGKTPYDLAVENGSAGVEGIFIAELHQAAFNGDAHKIVRFVRLGINVNAVGASGRVALHWAAEQGHKEAVNQLLRSKDIEVNVEDFAGQTPYCLAHINGHEETALLIKKRAGLMDKAVMAGKLLFGKGCKKEGA